jgi:hypothetical protein
MQNALTSAGERVSAARCCGPPSCHGSGAMIKNAVPYGLMPPSRLKPDQATVAGPDHELWFAQ